eukprot:4249429-Pleurochrysis_carterae.AAC.2
MDEKGTEKEIRISTNFIIKDVNILHQRLMRAWGLFWCPAQRAALTAELSPVEIGSRPGDMRS